MLCARYLVLCIMSTPYVQLTSKLEVRPTWSITSYEYVLFVFFITFIFFALVFSRTQVRGLTFFFLIVGSSPPLPSTVGTLHFYREKTAALSSLVDSRGTVPTHARRSHQLTHVYFFTDEVEISPRWDSNSRAQHHAQYSRVTTIIDHFRGNKYLVCVKRINLALQAA